MTMFFNNKHGFSILAFLLLYRGDRTIQCSYRSVSLHIGLQLLRRVPKVLLDNSCEKHLAYSFEPVRTPTF